MSFEYLEDIATADIAFRVTAQTLEELFLEAAEALVAGMIDNPDALEARVEKTLELEDTCDEMLLHDLLEELVYFKDAEQLILRVKHVSIQHQDDHVFLKGRAVGERIDQGRHHMTADIKAVTFYRFEIQQLPDGLEATVVLDV